MSVVISICMIIFILCFTLKFVVGFVQLKKIFIGRFMIDLGDDISDNFQTFTIITIIKILYVAAVLSFTKNNDPMPMVLLETRYTHISILIKNNINSIIDDFDISDSVFYTL